MKASTVWIPVFALKQQVGTGTPGNLRSQAQHLVKWQDPELGETRENCSAIADTVAAEDLEMLRRATAGEGAARWGAGSCNACDARPRMVLCPAAC